MDRPKLAPAKPLGSIVVIESDPRERERMVKALESEGYAVTAAPTLAAAITNGFWNAHTGQMFLTRQAPFAN